MKSLIDHWAILRTKSILEAFRALSGHAGSGLQNQIGNDVRFDSGPPENAAVACPGLLDWAPSVVPSCLPVLQTGRRKETIRKPPAGLQA